MSHRFTVALRVCLNCQQAFGVGLWPWSGAPWKRTHGLCQRCHTQLTAALDDERPAEHRSMVEVVPPAA
ncbi:MAG: hypothetical protein JRH16_14860 [Deltaproteobacteria bacterium]|nr:hypothetical protein [Deltaproteobacteria bacterium]MBW2361260.1 hypothetical protein [Deltaproteobacteria bacterium]